VGYNPWCGVTRLHDIASICRRYGGGGHPVVGAAAFPLSHLEQARDAARVIAAELAA
jgi:nanoRNase/pAp phosphatase (c-di-AMP/oligoRNAs hydrolase)